MKEKIKTIFTIKVLLFGVLFLLVNYSIMAQTSKSSENLRIEIIASGLDTPWAIDFASDGRIFVAERSGRITVIEKGITKVWTTLPVAENGEGGLLGLTLDPAFTSNGYVYAAYTYRSNGEIFNRLVRLKETQSQLVQDRILIDTIPGARNHNGGRVKFGPDGKIYFTTGDKYEQDFAQNMISLNGKILRMNPDGTIPDDNPFPGSYIYSLGHRNSQGLAWQPETNRLYATEHGPSGFQGSGQDEINLIEPGKNYGWPIIRGDEKQKGLESPILQSGTSTTWAPAGATFVTQGPWAGSFLFTGLRGKAIYRVVFDLKDPHKISSFESYLTGVYGRLRDVAEGPDGGIYVLVSNRDGRGRPSHEDDRILKITVL